MALAYGWGAGCGFGLGFLNFIGTILFILVLVWVLRFLFRGGFGWRGPRGGWYRGDYGYRGRHHRRGWFRDDALDEARSRLARGEIDAQEFERLRSSLGGDEGGDETPFERWLGARGDALEVLRRRLARGEIDVEEFERLRAALEH
ncbi:MAG: SHOCT domain-containing protein [Deinococcales bacterium]